jgi:hypothetical protein
VSRPFKTCSNCLYSPLTNGFGAEPAARCGRRDESRRIDLGSQRPRDFHIEVVAEASIWHSCSNCTSYRQIQALVIYITHRYIPVGAVNLISNIFIATWNLQASIITQYSENRYLHCSCWVYTIAQQPRMVFIDCLFMHCVWYLNIWGGHNGNFNSPRSRMFIRDHSFMAQNWLYCWFPPIFLLTKFQRPVEAWYSHVKYLWSKL